MVLQSRSLRTRPPRHGAQPSLLNLCPEIRCMIYHHLFRQKNGEILGLSREPEHNYDNGPPDDWTADSRQEGLVYNTDAERAEPTNSRFLRTCRTIYKEATPYFYGRNKIRLYAEDNNDIFYWLLDIGEKNRHAIRHLEISWAYGVTIESGRGDIHRLMETISDMQEAEEDEDQRHRSQLIRLVQGLEEKTIRLIIRTLNLLVSNQELTSLGVCLPGVDGGDIWDLPNSIYFAEEVFSNSTKKVHGCIPEAISRMVGLETLTIGYSKDIGLAEEIARATGARELFVCVCPEDHTLNLRQEERQEWTAKGWSLERDKARKVLVEDIPGEGKDGLGEESYGQSPTKKQKI